jgi:hypothetical protein
MVETRILEENIKNQIARELVEGLYISKTKDVISTPSLIPTEGEIRFLKKSNILKNFEFPAELMME